MAQRRSKRPVSGSQGKSQVFSFRLQADQAVQLNAILKQTNQSLAALVFEQIVTPPQARPNKQQSQSFAAIEAQQWEVAALHDAWIRKSQALDERLLQAAAFQRYFNVWIANRFLNPENFKNGDAERFARHIARVSLGRAKSEGRIVRYPTTIEIHVPGFQKPFPVCLTQYDETGSHPAEGLFIDVQDLANRWRQQMGV